MTNIDAIMLHFELPVFLCVVQSDEQEGPEEDTRSITASSVMVFQSINQSITSLFMRYFEV